MTITSPTVPRVIAQVRCLPGEFFARAEVANALGTSPATLRRLAVAEPMVFAPTSTVIYGTLAVPVYDASAVALLHAHLADHASRRGRPRLWTDEERLARRAAHSAAGYRRRRAAQLRDRGDAAAADRMLRDGDRIATGLRAAHRIRSAKHLVRPRRLITGSDVTTPPN